MLIFLGLFNTKKRQQIRRHVGHLFKIKMFGQGALPQTVSNIVRLCNSREFIFPILIENGTDQRRIAARRDWPIPGHCLNIASHSKPALFTVVGVSRSLIIGLEA